MNTYKGDVKESLNRLFEMNCSNDSWKDESSSASLTFNGGWQTSFGANSATYWECEALISEVKTEKNYKLPFYIFLYI